MTTYFTQEELDVKDDLCEYLHKQGYSLYAKILDKRGFHLTENPEAIGYMDPMTGVITLNSSLITYNDDWELESPAASLVVRHEILHNELMHLVRMLKWLAKNKGLDYYELEDMTLDELKSEIFSNRVYNMAADWEINRLGNTPADKRLIKTGFGIKQLDGSIRMAKGLVVDLDEPDLAKSSLEEMLSELAAREKAVKTALKNFTEKTNDLLNDGYTVVTGQFKDNKTFVTDKGDIIKL